MCYVEVCSKSVDFSLILLLRTSKNSKGWTNFESKRKIKRIEGKQFHGLGLSGFDTSYSRHSSLARAGYEVFTEACLTNLLLEEL